MQLKVAVILIFMTVAKYSSAFSPCFLIPCSLTFAFHLITVISSMILEHIFLYALLVLKLKLLSHPTSGRIKPYNPQPDQIDASPDSLPKILQHSYALLLFCYYKQLDFSSCYF